MNKSPTERSTTEIDNSILVLLNTFHDDDKYVDVIIALCIQFIFIIYLLVATELLSD